MRCRALVIGLLLGIFSLVRAEPKAYDIVKYQGKAAGVTVAFEFADGYPEASALKVVDTTSKKTTKFRMDAAGDATQFVPEKAGGTVQSVSLKMDLYGATPAKVSGSCVIGGKTVSFTLTKGK